MPDDDDFKRLEPEFLALARRIYDAGAKAALHRVMASIQVSMEVGTPVVARTPRARATGYGAVSGPVRDALIELATESPEGIGPQQIAEHFAHRGAGPDERQVRAALKTLTISGEAIRASRGRYLPRQAATRSPLVEEENPDADTSGDFDVAA
jgi:hypothetical protein